MSKSTQVFLETLVQAFMQNRMDTVASHFVYPLPLYLDETLQVFGKACTFTELLAIYRDTVLRAGITAIVPRLVAQGIEVNGYSNIWLELDHMDAQGNCMRTSQSHYILFNDGTSPFPQIELVEYLVSAFPEVSESFLLAKTA